MAINIPSLFRDVIETPEQRQRRKLAEQAALIPLARGGFGDLVAPLVQATSLNIQQGSEGLGRSVGGMLGLDMRDSSQKLSDALMAGDPNTPEGLRDLSKQLAGFYRDLNSSFSGLDARIPDETSEKGKESIRVWAKSNARLAALYKRRNQPEVAVPLLVEIIRLMAPTSTEGKEAYKDLIQLGFIETPYRGL